MRFVPIVWTLLLVTVGSLVVAQPHRHQIHHVLPREAEVETQIVSVPGPTVILYELNGELVSKEDVDQGLKNGTLVVVEGKIASQPVASSTQPPLYPPTPSPAASAAASTSAAPEPSPVVSSPSTAVVAPTPAPTPTTTPAPAPDQASASPSPNGETSPTSSSPSGSADTGNHGVDRDFPDGTLDCSHFPADYGALALDWLKLGGWIGLQQPTYNGDGSAVTDIVTAKSGPCAEGMMCSYACPSGYLKSQWPTAQGSSGQSVGGIECKNGKLHLPRAAESKKLCMPGTGGVKVHNTLGKSVALCRTDYPGTESMTIPATLEPASSDPYELSCPNEDSYYQWKGMKTSAQYYLNHAGTSLEDACTWGSAGSDQGNWAPVNLGVGKTDGTWLSIFPNKPTNPNAKLHFRVEIVGDHLGGSCEYRDGTYWQNGVANPDGCTVKVISGEAMFRFS